LKLELPVIALPSRTARAVSLSLILLLAACGSRANLEPVPEDLTTEAVVPGFETARYWGDNTSPEVINALLADRQEAMSTLMQTKTREGRPRELNFLAVSGGGQYGAFTAGALVGWSKLGTRPEFDIVTGISTGSIIAPFAFLGPEYDHVIETIYTTLSTKDVARKTPVAGLFGGSAFSDTAPLKLQIAKYVTPEFLELIAAEHAKGRRLLVGTTNLDAVRPVVWDMGRIAASGHPSAPELFRSVILASAAIPVAFPPVFFEVEAGGETFVEMHVDGGVSSQVAALAPQLPASRAADLAVRPTKRTLYVIMNGAARAPASPVSASALSIGAASVDALWYVQARGDQYRIYATAQRDRVKPYFAWMGEDFTAVAEEEFDPKFMKQLFDYGEQRLVSGTLWRDAPPGFR
jgi:hypothetical protein